MANNSFMKILKIILVSSLILAIIIGFITLLIYGFGNKFVDELEVKSAKLKVVSKGMSDIDLGELEGREGEGWTGELIDGYQDKTQKAMAKELLKIYEDVIRREGTLLKELSNAVGEEKALDLLMETLIGIHATEGSTYSAGIRSCWKGKTGVPEKGTYILSCYPVYKDYNQAKTQEGKIMNFTNYNYKDYNYARMKEFSELGHDINSDFAKENGYPKSAYVTSSGPQEFHAGYWSWAHRNEFGCIGPLQQTLKYWNDDHTYVVNVGQGFVGDIPKYVENSKKEGWVSKLDAEHPDIWNFPDNVEALYKNFIVHYAKQYSKSIKMEEFEKIQANIFGCYNRGPNGHTSDLHGNLEAFNEFAYTLYRDNDFWEESYAEFKRSKSHGSFRSIYPKYKEKHGFGKGTKLNYKGVKKGLQNTEYVLKAKFEGRAWYIFLRSIAYGGEFKSNPNQNFSSDKGQVVYNYMTAENPFRASGGANKAWKNKDEHWAIGWKGPYPLFNQTADDNANYHMTAGSTWKSACTWYAVTSASFGMGLTGKVDGFNIKSMYDFWSYFNPISAGSGTPLDLTKKPQKSVGTNMANVLRNAGYNIDEFPITSKDAKEKIMSALGSGLPVHIRTRPGKIYRGIKPKKSFSELDYCKHNMYDLDAYDWNDVSTTYTLASSGHSMIAVDCIESPVNAGKYYFSLVDSAYNHGNIDSNIMWWDADDLLNNYGNSNVWIVKGAENGDLIPIGNKGKIIAGDYGYTSTVNTGESPESLIYKIEGLTQKYEGIDTLLLENNTSNRVLATIPGKYKVRMGEVKPYESTSDTLYIITGKIGNNEMAIELKRSNKQVEFVPKFEGDSTQLFYINSGNTVVARIGYFRDDGEFIYNDILND